MQDVAVKLAQVDGPRDEGIGTSFAASAHGSFWHKAAQDLATACPQLTKADAVPHRPKLALALAFEKMRFPLELVGWLGRQHR